MTSPGSGATILVGPAGQIELTEGVIAAKRHIHADPASAAEMGVKDKDIVKVKLDTEGRALIFDDVVVPGQRQIRSGNAHRHR